MEPSPHTKNSTAFPPNFAFQLLHLMIHRTQLLHGSFSKTTRNLSARLDSGRSHLPRRPPSAWMTRSWLRWVFLKILFVMYLRLLRVMRTRPWRRCARAK